MKKLILAAILTMTALPIVSQADSTQLTGGNDWVLCEDYSSTKLL